MPVTARLSRKFYERMGEDIAQELVDWFNMVDATYRHDLREINELNFARFDAKLEQRVAELDTKFQQRFAKFEQRFAALDAKFEQRFAELDAKIEQRVAALDTKLEQRASELNARIDTAFANVSEKVETRSASVRTDLIKWMFVFWATNALIVFGLVSRFWQG